MVRIINKNVAGNEVTRRQREDVEMVLNEFTNSFPAAFYTMILGSDTVCVATEIFKVDLDAQSRLISSVKVRLSHSKGTGDACAQDNFRLMYQERVDRVYGNERYTIFYILTVA